MIFTRTIRRKLVVGLLLVLMMLLAMSYSGISGLLSYRQAIHELDHELHKSPHQSDLMLAVGQLLEPARWNSVKDEAVEYQQEQLRLRLEECSARVLELRHKFEELPPAKLPASQRPIAEAMFRNIDTRLNRISQLQAQLSHDASRSKVQREILEDVLDLQRMALNFPDPTEGLGRTLQQARTDYRSALAVLWMSTAVVIVLFGWLVRNGYVWVFAPIRKLHQGALRVAQGDFDYRVTLATRDEMSELAGAFNQMTCRFQEIRNNLDRQVRERSQQLVRADRLANVGFLSAGVAHEINNPLSAITMAAESLEYRLASLLEQLPPDDAAVVRQYLTLIQNESFRCKQITERLLDFSRGRDAQREPTDLVKLVREVVAMVQFLSKHRDKKIEFTHDGTCTAVVNGPEIKQVILNLVANGLEAMEPGGTLTIHLVEQTDSILLTCQDDGCGMTQEVIDHMFEPFFTRKQNGQGTGLGLSISHRIVHEHRGTITAHSEGPGQGCTFRVHIPKQALENLAAA